jgi:hypothetical protein
MGARGKGRGRTEERCSTGQARQRVGLASIRESAAAAPGAAAASWARTLVRLRGGRALLAAPGEQHVGGHLRGTAAGGMRYPRTSDPLGRWSCALDVSAAAEAALGPQQEQHLHEQLALGGLRGAHHLDHAARPQRDIVIDDAEPCGARAGAG